VTRFILICNYVTRIIEPLASRCAKFRFQPLPIESMQQRLNYIAEQEQCSLSEAVRSKILSIAGGDMRRAVTTLQSAHMLTHSAESSSDFSDEQKRDDSKPSAVDMNVDLIEEMAGFPPVSLIDVLWNGIESMDFATLERCVREDILTEGFSIPSILNLVSERLISSTELSDLTKADVSIAIAEADKFLIDGADDYLQLTNVCALLMGRMAKDKEMKQ
jgi:replication factor C subunit 2/4